MNGTQAYVLAKKYTDDTASQFGALKGASCQIQSVTYDSDENAIITFKWENTAGEVKTTQVTVKSGASKISELGDVNIDDLQVGDILVYDDDTQTWVNKSMPNIPTKISDLTNDSNFQTEYQVQQSISDATQNYTERIRLTTDGNAIYNGTTALTFNDVKTLVMDSKKFITVTLDDNVSFIPSAYDGDAIWFDNGFIESGVANQVRLIINKNDEIKIDQLELANKDVVDRLSNFCRISEDTQNALTQKNGKLFVSKSSGGGYDDTEVRGLIQDNTDEINQLSEKVADIELFKFPNAVIHGEPTINNGQISGFSNTNYLVFPSVFDLSGRGFEFKFTFTTKDDVTVPQNILGGKYCMALFVQNGKLNLRVSSNGSSWDIVNLEGTATIEANKTYYVKINFTRLNYVLSLSTDDETYNEIGSVSTGDISPHPSEIYIGVGNNFNNPFKGIINLNKCYLKVNQSVIWQGMDDAGLSTRLATDLDNIDSEGIAKIKEIASEVADGTLANTELKMLGWTVPKECPIQNEINNNQFVQKVGRVDLGTCSWTKYDVTQGTLFRTAVIDNMKTVDNYDTIKAFLYGYSASSSNARKEKTISNTTVGFDVVDSTYSDASDFKTAMQGKYLYYELATPITKQIDGNEVVEKFKAYRTYSTEEQIVGVWVDDTPMYRRCFALDNLQIEPVKASSRYASSLNLTEYISSSAEIKSITGCVTISSSDGDTIPLQIGSTIMAGDTTKTIQRCLTVTGRNVIFYSTYANDRMINSSLIVEYTKSATPTALSDLDDN